MQHTLLLVCTLCLSSCLAAPTDVAANALVARGENRAVKSEIEQFNVEETTTTVVTTSAKVVWNPISFVSIADFNRNDIPTVNHDVNNAVFISGALSRRGSDSTVVRSNSDADKSMSFRLKEAQCEDEIHYKEEDYEGIFVSRGSCTGADDCHGFSLGSHRFEVGLINNVFMNKESTATFHTSFAATPVCFVTVQTNKFGGYIMPIITQLSPTGMQVKIMTGKDNKIAKGVRVSEDMNEDLGYLCLEAPHESDSYLINVPELLLAGNGVTSDDGTTKVSVTRSTDVAANKHVLAVVTGKSAPGNSANVNTLSAQYSHGVVSLQQIVGPDAVHLRVDPVAQREVGGFKYYVEEDDCGRNDKNRNHPFEEPVAGLLWQSV